jgi:hypothetical protein
MLNMAQEQRTFGVHSTAARRRHPIFAPLWIFLAFFAVKAFFKASTANRPQSTQGLRITAYGVQTFPDS